MGGAAAGGEARIAEFLAANPGAKAWQDASSGLWLGTVPVDDVRWLSTRAVASPAALADALEELTGAVAQVLAIEAEFPGWTVRRWVDGRWTAVQGEGEGAPAARAADPDGLRAEIKRITAAMPAAGA